jgi:hypothetical protein
MHHSMVRGASGGSPDLTGGFVSHDFVPARAEQRHKIDS